jgi:hypothetical protein
MGRLLARLQYIDVRIVYLIFAVCAAAPLVLQLKLPVPPSKESLGLFNEIENCPKDKIVLIHSTWDVGIQGECWGQYQAVVEHLLRRGVKFIVCSIDVPTAPEMAKKAMDSREVKAICKKYNRVYGVDWVQLGFTPSGSNFSTVQAMAKNFEAAYASDYIESKPLSELPLTKKYRNIRDVQLIYAVGYGSDERWLSFIRGVYGTDVAFAAAGISTSGYYPYLQSHQIVGMLAGVRGAAEYESLVHTKYGQLDPERGMGTRLIVPQAFCHMLIIVFVVLGNIGYFTARRMAAERERSGG